MNSLSALNRTGNLDRLKSELFDLVIVGGGINGAGIARDAISRGMTVALVEAKDYAIGTSSRSSKLVHGGIRYLENLEFNLVFEALSERRKLFALAPHLVHPLRFVIPLYRGGRVGVRMMGLGMFLYDALALFETPEPAEHLSPTEVADFLPSLQQQELLGAYAYSDAYMDDDRLVIETLRSAARQGACVENYLEAEAGEFSEGKLSAIQVRDRLSGAAFKVRGRHFVSTVGPWTDRVLPRVIPQWRPRLRPSKGVHLTFHRDRLPLASAVVMAAEKRIVFGIPRHEMVIVGTTDTDFTGDPYDVRTEVADVEYLMQVIAKYFPGAGITPGDIIGCYAGVRPLVADDAESESQTSREHQILTLKENLTVVMGGKYTTYRLIAEQAVNSALSAFRWEDQVRFARGHTTEPLNPLVTPDIYNDRERRLRILEKNIQAPRRLLEALFDRHGGEAEEILRFASQPAETWEATLWLVEARHAIHHTGCRKISDFFFRRTPLVLSSIDHGRNFLPLVRDIFQQELGLSDAELDKQSVEFESELRHALGWRTNF